MTKVKICGITCLEDLGDAVQEGADALGFVVGVPSSPRNLDIEKANTLISNVPIFVTSVLVTIPGKEETLIQLSRDLRPDALQLHGETIINPELLREKMPDIELIRAVHTVYYRNQPLDANLLQYDAILGDTKIGKKHGGTGRVHNWEISRRIRESLSTPFILAGGLNPKNVVAAVSIVKPYAVDVSTGVESSPGRKDRMKIAEFIRNVKTV